MKIFAPPPETAFLPALARAWLAAQGDAAAGLIILPSRRSARALAGAFLQANAGRALLLPRIIAFGALDEAGLSLTTGLDLPPAIPPMHRQALLAKLILAMRGRNGAPQSLPAAWALAADLARLLDEADAAEINLAEALPGLVAAELASHWQTTLEFLEIVTSQWPAILAEMGLLNPAARQVLLIDAQNTAWLANPPAARVWMVARDATPALARLARTVAGLPSGAVILPGYDPAMPAEAWEDLDDSHAQSGIARLLGVMGARRDEILLWPAVGDVPTGRSKLLSRALLPASHLKDWQQPAPMVATQFFRLEAAEEQQDATAIAMILRAALERPGRSAALITPDRGLAIRVAAALKRFGITADDSAGEPLADTPPAILLRLLARAAARDFAPLPLLAFLKHPLTAAGLPPEICRSFARRLELAALRGPRPSPGFAGIRFRLEAKNLQAEVDFLARLELRIAPLAGLALAVQPAAALRALIAAGEACAATPDEAGAARLWAGEAGTALSDALLEILAALEELPDIAPADLADLLDAVLAGHVVRRPRAKDGHPRIAIWGVQEAMLQSVDVAVLGGLVEGVWPGLAEPGPWMSRPMRRAAGLPSPEAAIGLAAHDFFSLAASCGTVVLAAPSRRERAPAVPARWLTRLEAMLGKDGLARHPAASWAAALDTPVERIMRPKPAPRPPAASRPREMSISGIATLLADPYAIYAGKILKIRELDGLDEESDESLFGNIVHAGLAAYYTPERDFSTPGAAAALNVTLQSAMRAQRPRAALEAWWAARLQRIADWIVAAERERRAHGNPATMKVEVNGKLTLPGGYILNGRADRIEKNAAGGVFIADYKTGSVPKAKDVQSGAAPQLPLEAVMAEAGCFGPQLAGDVTELAYWKLSGRHEPGEDKPLFNNKPDELRAVIENAGAMLPDLFAKFADETTPYLAAPHPDRATYKDVYAGISRRREWGGESGDDDAA